MNIECESKCLPYNASICNRPIHRCISHRYMQVYNASLYKWRVYGAYKQTNVTKIYITYDRCISFLQQTAKTFLEPGNLRIPMSRPQ